MKVENLYRAKATGDLIQNDPVVIFDGKCKRATGFKEKIYHVLDLRVSPGEIANLAGEDTVFHIQKET